MNLLVTAEDWRRIMTWLCLATVTVYTRTNYTKIHSFQQKVQCTISNELLFSFFSQHTNLIRMTQPSAINKKLVLMYTLRHIDNCKHFRLATNINVTWHISIETISTYQRKTVIQSSEESCKLTWPVTTRAAAPEKHGLTLDIIQNYFAKAFDMIPHHRVLSKLVI